MGSQHSISLNRLTMSKLDRQRACVFTGIQPTVKAAHQAVQRIRLPAYGLLMGLLMVPTQASAIFAEAPKITYGPYLDCKQLKLKSAMGLPDSTTHTYQFGGVCLQMLYVTEGSEKWYEQKDAVTTSAEGTWNEATKTYTESLDFQPTLPNSPWFGKAVSQYTCTSDPVIVKQALCKRIAVLQDTIPLDLQKFNPLREIEINKVVLQGLVTEEAAVAVAEETAKQVEAEKPKPVTPALWGSPAENFWLSATSTSENSSVVEAGETLTVKVYLSKSWHSPIPNKNISLTFSPDTPKTVGPGKLKKLTKWQDAGNELMMSEHVFSFDATAKPGTWTVQACFDDAKPYNPSCTLATSFHVGALAESPDWLPGGAGAKGGQAKAFGAPLGESGRSGGDTVATPRVFGARVPRAAGGQAPDGAATGVPEWGAPSSPQITKPRAVAEQRAPTVAARPQPDTALTPTAKLHVPSAGANNLATAAATATTADLKVTKLYHDNTCNLWAVIENSGKARIAAEVADAYWINGKPAGGGKVSLNLAPGQSASHKFNRVGATSYEGAEVKYQVDTNNALPEIDKRDNVATTKLTCTVAQTRRQETPPAASSGATRTVPSAPATPAESEQPSAGRLQRPSR